MPQRQTEKICNNNKKKKKSKIREIKLEHILFVIYICLYMYVVLFIIKQIHQSCVFNGFCGFHLNYFKEVLKLFIPNDTLNKR